MGSASLITKFEDRFFGFPDTNIHSLHGDFHIHDGQEYIFCRKCEGSVISGKHFHESPHNGGMEAHLWTYKDSREKWSRIRRRSDCRTHRPDNTRNFFEEISAATEILVEVENKESDLPIINPVSLQGQPVPERRWIVPDWIPVHQTTAFYGDGGTGKSLLAMQLMTAAATRKSWLGLNVAPVKTLGFFCEDTPDELHRRQEQINRGYGCDFSDLENILWFSGVGENNLLMEFDGDVAGKLTALYVHVTKKAREFGAQLIVIDTAADTFGGNENIRGQVRNFIQALTRLAIDVDGAIILCAHPSVAGMASGEGYGGSTAWNNSVRSRLYLNRPKDDDGQDNTDVRILSRKKSNYSRAGDEIPLIWDDGIFVPQGSPYSGGIVGAIEKRSREKQAQEAFLRAMDDFERQGRQLSSSNRSGNYAPKLMLGNSHCKGFNKKELLRAMESLFDMGTIREEAYGRGSNPSNKIVKVKPEPERNGCV